MIIFGAGSSVPFGIPGMVGFTEGFKASIKSDTQLSSFIEGIEDTIGQSKEMVGTSIPFDLETLLSILTDLSATSEGKPISIPTVTVLLKEGITIQEAYERYRQKSITGLQRLRDYIFEKCMKPIKKGKEKGDFSFLDQFYNPLMTVLNKADLKNVQEHTRRVYSTNWDLCFKVWADYANIPVNDGTDLDRSSLPVLNVRKFESMPSTLNYVALHGSLDLIKINREKEKGVYKDVFKIPDPIRYFDGKPDNIKDAFIIYPLEAIGYEESIKSPYLDMLHNFRNFLEAENTVFIIGYSLRDPTVGSILEEVIAKRIREGDILPLFEDIDKRKSVAREDRFKIIVIDSNPEKIAENLKSQSRLNLLSVFIPVRIEFPQMADPDFQSRFARAIVNLAYALKEIGHFEESSFNAVKEFLTNRHSTFADEFSAREQG